MSLDFKSEFEYFNEALDLFYDARWLYEFPVTEILIKSFLSKFPDGWINSLRNLHNDELNELVVNKITKRDFPESLLSFVEKSIRLDRLREITMNCDIKLLPESFKTGLSEKKQHEILRLANLVHEQCSRERIETIVDLGAGLGYVCQLLHFFFNYRVLGLEFNAKNVETAKRRQNMYYPTSKNRVNYICTKIDLNSEKEIENYLTDFCGSSETNFCLIGLHACADLGVDACKLFSKISSAKLLILLSCCYHKLEISEGKNMQEKRFRNFPVSKCLTKILDNSRSEYYEIFKRPFLRLACQEPAIRWKEMSEDSHQSHAFHVLARAVLELFASENSITLKKRVHKATRKSQCSNFETYLEDAFLRYEFNSNTESLKSEEIREKLLSAWKNNSELSRDAEIYTGLQLLLQSSAESLVLEDRRCWLKEMGFRTEIIPVNSRIISPRSHAIVSSKMTE